MGASAEYKRVETTAWSGGERPRYDMGLGYLASSASVAKFGKKTMFWEIKLSAEVRNKWVE